MKLNSMVAGALVLGAVALTMRSQTAPPKPAALSAKIAVIVMRDAIAATQEGKAAMAKMQDTYGPRRTKAEKEDAAIGALEDQLKKGAATMSAEARQRLNDEIAARRKKLDRDLEDLNAEVQMDDNRLMQEITGKLGAVIDKTAKQNGYTVVMDASAPLLWAADSANITPEIVKAYDTAHPVK